MKKKPIKGIEISISKKGKKYLLWEIENRKGGLKAVIKDKQKMMAEFIKIILRDDKKNTHKTARK